MIEILTNCMTALGFRLDPDQRFGLIFNYGEFSVSCEEENNGLWIWVDNGRQIVRRFCKTEKEVDTLADKIRLFL